MSHEVYVNQILDQLLSPGLSAAMASCWKRMVIVGMVETSMHGRVPMHHHLKPSGV